MDKVEQNEMGDAIEKGGPWLTVEEALQAIDGLPFTQEDRGRATQWLEGNCHLVRHWTLPKILAAYASHVATEKDEEIARLRGCLSNLVEAVDDLIAESEGVYGLRLNGDPSLWEELIEVGWLLALEEAKAALEGEKADV